MRSSCPLLLSLCATAGALQLKITGTSLTEPLRAYADQKLGKPLDRYADMLRDDGVEVNLKVEKLSKHDSDHRGQVLQIAEITALCADRHIIHCTTSTDDMYASIDDLENMLARRLRKYKERKITVGQGRRRESKEEMQAIEDDDDLDDAAPASASTASDAVEDPIALVRRKNFPMPPISVSDAVTCLEYIDHDFYVFRNVQSGEINVVYKRNSGGVGLIEPERN